MPGGGTRTFLEPDQYEASLGQAQIAAVITPAASSERASPGPSSTICKCCGVRKIPHASPMCSLHPG